MRIVKENTLGVVVDIQEKLYPHMYEKDKLLNNSKILLQGLQTLEIPILVTQQYTKGLGGTLPEITKLLGEFNYTEKLTFSCCGEPSFLRTVMDHQREYVILFGIETHVCVLQTAMDLRERGYTPVVIEDCVSSRKESDKRVAIERIRHEGGIISTYESILFELCQSAEEGTFKTISKLVK
jgi:nicotinamidase-related amidase